MNIYVGIFIKSFLSEMQLCFQNSSTGFLANYNYGIAVCLVHLVSRVCTPCIPCLGIKSPKTSDTASVLVLLQDEADSGIVSDGRGAGLRSGQDPQAEAHVS